MTNKLNSVPFEFEKNDKQFIIFFFFLWKKKKKKRFVRHIKLKLFLKER